MKTTSMQNKHNNKQRCSLKLLIRCVVSQNIIISGSTLVKAEVLAVCCSEVASVCVNKMPRREDISNEVRELNDAAPLQSMKYLNSIILERFSPSGKHLTIFPGMDTPAKSPEG
ncbi:hypothetical protein ILYODFUR_039027 [Ilyodon furcidens]|uniref:Uncharacterized protein n=1 Tax=Ilyodon furcidens TaxID=33524 RepID=A0ABV0U1R8_9TELE